MPEYEVPSREDVQTSGDWKEPLPGQEDYLARIAEITPTTRPNFSGVATDFLTVRFEIDSFADGAPLEDLKGLPVEPPRWIWKDVDPKKLGFMTNGTPSISRQFFAAANGINDPEAHIPPFNTDDFLERKVVLSLSVYTSVKDGKQRNKVTAIKTIGRRGRSTTAPAVDPEYAAAVQDLTF